ncbi:uncharacterized protein K452DRAFT_311069 [Aplosporella prunicola CBS 121167]|uniref:DUF8035 domain-containing protein n=1 Tax=Aplosporella prunicola CBS 121167 TaxID=1176127 RepID=A0A6A6B7E7_9PEZI|nr:uncharacterized protein K452DRAFT_311069 [Aplosporella prunicola CBS 121167]KAF2139134.1 hypothetical protein K452DRAFT_311069 [Aplosporella prunicola CBS 121167]
MSSVLLPSRAPAPAPAPQAKSRPPQRPAAYYARRLSLPPVHPQSHDHHVQPVPQSPTPVSPRRQPMDSRHYHRPPSPGSRRLAVPERASTGTFGYDAYYNTTYRSPRSSGERIVPSSTTNYSTQPSAATRSSVAGYDAYSGRPRHSTIEERQRPATVVSGGMPLRTTTHNTVVHSHDRQTSPPSRSYDSRANTYVTPATSVQRSSSSKQGHSHGHRKVYSIDDGKAVRVDPRELDTAHKRESGSYRHSGNYHPSSKRQDLNDEGYSYTNAAGMYRDTEPSWRRDRRGSVDGGSRRPLSMVEAYGPRSSARELGPPVTTRGFDRINEAPVGRSGSVRDYGRPTPRDRSRDRPSTADSYHRDDTYRVPERTSSVRQPLVHQDDRREDRYAYRDDYDDRSDPRRSSRRFEDPDVEARGFGIRPPSNVDPYPREESLDRRPPPPALYQVDPSVQVPNVNDYIPAPPRDEGRREYRDYRDYERDRPRERDYESDRERERRRDHDRDRDDRRDRDRDLLAGIAPAAVAAVSAAYGAPRHARDHKQDSDEERRREPRKKRSDDSDEAPRERHYEDVRERERREPRDKPTETLDPDEDYRRRIQQELERSSGSVDRTASDSEREKERRRRERHERRGREETGRTRDDGPSDQKYDRYSERHNSVFGESLVDEPGSMSAPEERDDKGRVRIVTLPKSDKESTPPPKGILRKPTEKFPEDPNPIREGVAPMKDAKKGKDIPPDARWTKIDRRLVNPEALEEAKERFEERMDCVIVLRVLTKEDIQKLADRTREIRDGRGKYKSLPAPPDVHASSDAEVPRKPAALTSSSSSSLSDNDNGERERHRSRSRSRSKDDARTHGDHHKHKRRHRRRHSSSHDHGRHGGDDRGEHTSSSSPHAAAPPSDGDAERSSRPPRTLSALITPVLDQVLTALTRDKEDEYRRESRHHDREHRDRDRERDRHDERDRERRHHRRHRDRDDEYDSDESSEGERKERKERLRIEAPPVLPVQGGPLADVLGERDREREREQERERQFYVDPSR